MLFNGNAPFQCVMVAVYDFLFVQLLYHFFFVTTV
jgi:hypothetical protein